MLDGGHARNALAQRAGANVNCRIFPGHSIEEIRAELAGIIGRSRGDGYRPAAAAPVAARAAARSEGHGSGEEAGGEIFPGVPVIPTMSNGYTDATFLGAVGIPTYGVPARGPTPTATAPMG